MSRLPAQLVAVHKEVPIPRTWGSQKRCRVIPFGDLTFQAEQLALLPRHVSESRGIGRNEENHREHDKAGPLFRVVSSADKLSASLLREVYGD